jgi:hypothetical protein
MYAIAIFLTYNLQFYVPFTLLWPRICRKILYKYNDKAKAKFEHAFRIGLILITCKLKDLIRYELYRKDSSSSIYQIVGLYILFLVAIAALIPNLGLVISLGILSLLWFYKIIFY